MLRVMQDFGHQQYEGVQDPILSIKAPYYRLLIDPCNPKSPKDPSVLE